MQPDPQRQWFVYFREKEMGPLSETEVSAKLKAGELDASAYLFTEGMTDWTPLDELNVFHAGAASRAPSPLATPAANPTVASASQKASVASTTEKLSEKKTEKLGDKSKTEEARKASEPTIIPSAAKSEAAPAPKQPRSKSRPLLVAGLAAAFVASGIYYWIDQMPPSPPPAPPKPVVAAPPPPPPAPEAYDWSELLLARKSRDLKDGAFRIGKKNIGDAYPIVPGAISPLLETKSIWVMIYPDNTKNLLPVMKVWTFHVPVVDGLFAVGPLHLEGEPLPPGTYHVLAAYDGKDIAKGVGFEHGTWPTPEKLVEIQAKLQQERGLFAQKEKSTLESRMQDIGAALQQLQTLGPKANLGPRGRKDWTASAGEWDGNFRSRMAEQREVLMGPMFYPGIQSKLYDFMTDVSKLYQAMDEVSAKGLKAFAAKDKKGLGGRWVDVRKRQENLAGKIRVLGEATEQPLKIDEEALKRQLLELSLSNQGDS